MKGHAKVDVLSTNTGVSITYLKQWLSGPVDIDRVQLVSHGRLLTSGPLKESLGLLTPTQVLTLTPKVLGAGKRARSEDRRVTWEGSLERSADFWQRRLEEAWREGGCRDPQKGVRGSPERVTGSPT